MEARAATDALARLRASPLTAFLIPSLSSPRYQLSRLSASAFSPSSITSCRTLSQSNSRGFVASSSRRQQSSAAAKDPEEDDDSSASAPSTSSPAHPSSAQPETSEGASSFQDQVASIIDSVPKSKAGGATGQQRTSRFTSPGAQTENRPGNSANDVLRNFNEHVLRTQQARQGRGAAAFQADRMQMPSSSSMTQRGAGGPASRYAPPPPPAALPPLRLNPSIGRSVPVTPNRGVDLERAFNLLNMKCAQNTVRSDMQRQRFHERPGMKRKRLKADRWRRKFKDGFRSMVYRVQDMKRKGW